MRVVAWLIGVDHLGAPAGEGYAPGQGCVNFVS